MLFYCANRCFPVMASLGKQDRAQHEKMNDVAKKWDDDWLYDTSTEELWGTIEQARFPLKYMGEPLFREVDEQAVADRVKKTDGRTNLPSSQDGWRHQAR